jgi:AcrR family transcriptional regulator
LNIDNICNIINLNIVLNGGAQVRNKSDQRSTKEKIIQAVMSIISEEGVLGITTRKIAARAGANIAAINYHFGSKDALITEALRYFTVQLMGTFRILQEEKEEPEVLLSKFIKGYTSVICEYTDIVKYMMSQLIMNKPLEGHAEYAFFIQSEGIELIKQVIARIRPGSDDRILSLMALNLVSGLTMPFIMGDSIRELMSLDLLSKEIQDNYAELLIDNIRKS